MLAHVAEFTLHVLGAITIEILIFTVDLSELILDLRLLVRVDRLELPVFLVFGLIILIIVEDSESIIKIWRYNVAVIFVLVLPAEWLGELIVTGVKQDIAGLAVHGDFKSKQKQASFLVHITHKVAEVATGK